MGCSIEFETWQRQRDSFFLPDRWYHSLTMRVTKCSIEGGYEISRRFTYTSALNCNGMLVKGRKNLNFSSKGCMHLYGCYERCKLFQYFLLTDWFSSSRRPVPSVIWELKLLSSVSVARYHSWCGNLLRNVQSEDRIPVGARFSDTFRTGPGAHPAWYTMDTASFGRVKRPGSGVNHPPHKGRLRG